MLRLAEGLAHLKIELMQNSFFLLIHKIHSSSTSKLNQGKQYQIAHLIAFNEYLGCHRIKILNSSSSPQSSGDIRLHMLRYHVLERVFDADDSIMSDKQYSTLAKVMLKINIFQILQL